MIINAPRYAGLGLLDSLEVWWPKDATSGTRVNAHTTGSSLDLADNNSVGFTAGVQSNAANYARNSNHYLSIAAAIPSNLQFVDEDFTFAGVFRLLDIGTVHWIMAHNTTSGAANYAYLLNIQTNGDMHFGVSDGTSFGTAIKTSLSAATQYTFFAEHDSVNNEVRLTLNNGTPAITSWSTGCNANAGGFYFGKAAHVVGSTVEGMNGWQDEMGCWRGLLNTDQKTFLHNGGAWRSYGEL